MRTWADRILAFQKNLFISQKLPAGIDVLNPYRQPEVSKLCKKFYQTFYRDTHPRTMILGINPGRLGAGLTGIPFTDPAKLEKLGITNSFPKKAELSADFIYTMIDAFGGPVSFYQQFYFSSVSPLGFVKEGKNLNYYDIPELAKKLHPFIIDCLHHQLSWGINRNIVYCLGEGENYKFFSRLNAEYGFFSRLVPLSHPRFIMQYRRKKIKEYAARYVNEFQNGISL
ncbi:MAG: DUF4918 family protein [Bacteroidetes bacterium]|nr:DUF4918 family protein [Bacteroidota bacterium]